MILFIELANCCNILFIVLIEPNILLEIEQRLLSPRCEVVWFVSGPTP